jgi:excisionase family DNA binding protein
MGTELFDKRTVASYLGVRVGTVNRLMREGHLEALKVGRCVRFDDRAVCSFLKNTRVNRGTARR